MNVRLRIERVQLEGTALAPADRVVFGRALEAALTELLTSGGLARELIGGGSVPSVAVPPIAGGLPNTARELGRSVGVAVYDGIGNPDSIARPHESRRESGGHNGG
jgi:hypothetical protein